MSVAQSQTKDSKFSAEEILHEFQWFIIMVALIFTSIGFLIDTLQLLKAFKWIAPVTSDESRLFYIVYNNYAVLISMAVIGGFGYLLYLVLKRKIKVVNATLWYALLVCLNTTVPYLWITQNQEAVAGYLWRDYVMFTILVFVVSTCTRGRYVYYVALYAVLLSVLISLLSDHVFLRENIPMFLFTIAGFAYCLWKKDTLLQKIVSKQSEEKKKIEELSLFKEKMNFMLFHDIKVPLNSIIKQTNSSFKESSAPLIGLQAEKAKRMLSNMIDIASSTDARLELSSTGFKLSGLLAKVSQDSLYNIHEKSISIAVDFEGIDCELFADRDLIERALINVVDNAVKYSPGNGQITILAKLINDWVTILIRDQGPGIKEIEREKIFQLFYAAEQPEGVEKSSGIGLAFCKLVVEAHGGTIHIHSPEGGGSEFIISLPIVASEAEASGNSEEDVRKTYSEELKMSLKHILPELRNLKYYQTSEIYSLLSSLDSLATMNNNEIEEIKAKALSCNPIYYSELIQRFS
jgi:signal transduction histidine kinase